MEREALIIRKNKHHKTKVKRRKMVAIRLKTKIKKLVETGMMTQMVVVVLKSLL